MVNGENIFIKENLSLLIRFGNDIRLRAMINATNDITRIQKHLMELEKRMLSFYYSTELNNFLQLIFYKSTIVLIDESSQLKIRKWEVKLSEKLREENEVFGCLNIQWDS